MSYRKTRRKTENKCWLIPYRERERETERETEINRDRETETETDRETKTETDRENIIFNFLKLLYLY